MGTHNSFSWQDKKNINNFQLKKCLSWSYAVGKRSVQVNIFSYFSVKKYNFGYSLEALVMNNHKNCFFIKK